MAAGHPPTEPPASRTRVAEVLAALSLTTDLASGVPLEKGLQVCVLADEFARQLGVDEPTRATVFQAALLESVGCTSHAPENAAMFEDDVAFQRMHKELDPGAPTVFAQQMTRFGAWAGPRAGELARRFLEEAPTIGPVAATGACDVSRALAPRVGAVPRAVAALDDVYERWDGLGIPAGRRGDQLAWEARLLHVAERAVRARMAGGDATALAEVARRSGGHLDPELAGAFLAEGRRLLTSLHTADLLADVLAREPGVPVLLRADELAELCAVLGLVADLKSTHLIGHSAHVARLAAAAGEHAGLLVEARHRLVTSAHLHNLGCAVVPSSLLDAAVPTGAAALERLRLHGYWTGRILRRCPSLARLEPMTRPAAAFHASLAEGGYRDWARASDLPTHAALPVEARLLEAAEAYASLTEPRPGREPLAEPKAAAVLRRAVADGRLDGISVDHVLTSEAQPPPRRATVGPTLSPREIEVLRLTARGLSNKEIATRLYISDRTVGHHLEHVFDKTGHRTRAGVAVWAAQHGLLP
jgi:HD-GYP domain-containing protein (c-di-GMP phosphodiesterase class II)